MTIFTDHLRTEHRIIERALRLLDAYAERARVGTQGPFSKLNLVVANLHILVEGIHHAKEERLLFPALDLTGSCSQGGPRCGYFTDVRLNYNRAAEILQTSKGSNPAEENITFGRASTSGSGPIWPNSHPLSIPMEEHHAGKLALQNMELALHDFQLGKCNGQCLYSSVHDYTDLLNLHIQKEDTCLFKMADSALEPSKQEELLKLSHDFDSNQTQYRESDFLALLEDLSSCPH